MILLSQTVLKAFLNIWKIHTETLNTCKWIELKADYLGISANALNFDLSMWVSVFSNNKISHLWRAPYSIVRPALQPMHENETDRAPGNTYAVHIKINSKLSIRFKTERKAIRSLFTFTISIGWGSKPKVLCSQYKFYPWAVSLGHSIPFKPLWFHAYPNSGGFVRNQIC